MDFFPGAMEAEMKTRAKETRTSSRLSGVAGGMGLAIWIAVALVVPSQAASRSAEPSKKLNIHTFFERGEQLFIGVDTRAASSTKRGEIVPLGLAMANLSKVPVSVNRESFALEAPDGTRIPLISLEEFNREYNRSRMDARLADTLFGMMLSRFDGNRFTPFRLFPTRGGRTNATNSVELGRRFWTQNYLYFRIPETSRTGDVFTLLVDTGDEARAIVNFEL